MRKATYNEDESLNRFFLVSLSHESLESYYKVNFALIHIHKWSIDFLDNMMPWERDIYSLLLVNHIQEEENRKSQPK